MNGQQSNLFCNYELKETRFDPNLIKKTRRWFDPNDGALCRIEFFYEKKQWIKCSLGFGRKKFDDENPHKYDDTLSDGERIVGIASITPGDAEHYDFSFIIAKRS